MKRTNFKIAAHLAACAKNEDSTLAVEVSAEDSENLSAYIDAIQKAIKVCDEPVGIGAVRISTKLSKKEVTETYLAIVSKIRKEGGVEAYAKKVEHVKLNKAKDTYVHFPTMKIVDTKHKESFAVSVVFILDGEILYGSSAHSSLFYIFKKNKFYSLFVD